MIALCPHPGRVGCTRRPKPLEYEIDAELGALVIHVRGPVDISDFMKAPDQISVTPGFKRDMNELVDFRTGALDLAEYSSREFAQSFGTASVRERLGSNYKLAFVAERSVDFGQLRMFETHPDEHLDQRGVEARVFYSLEDAKSWLHEESD